MIMNLETDSAEKALEIMSKIGDQVMQYAPAALETSISVNVRTPSLQIVPISDPNRYAPVRNGRRAWSKSYTPNHSGTLARSYTQEVRNNDGKSFELKVGYEAPYAFFVHERDDASTNWSRPGSHSKFISTPVKNNKDKIVSDMVKDIFGRLQA